MASDDSSDAYDIGADTVVDDVLSPEIQDALVESGFELEPAQDTEFPSVIITFGGETFVLVDYEDGQVELYAVGSKDDAGDTREVGALLQSSGSGVIEWDRAADDMVGFAASGGYQAQAAMLDTEIDDREAAYDQALDLSDNLSLAQDITAAFDDPDSNDSPPDSGAPGIEAR